MIFRDDECRVRTDNGPANLKSTTSRSGLKFIVELLELLGEYTLAAGAHGRASR